MEDLETLAWNPLYSVNYFSSRHFDHCWTSLSYWTKTLLFPWNRVTWATVHDWNRQE